MDHANTEVAVIGAGGAGLAAGIAAARAGARTVVYERMAQPAKKVAISGGGRCNFSNTLGARDFVKLFGDPHAKRLGQALKALSGAQTIALLAKHGVEGKVERGYRLYTQSGRGMDVVNALVGEFRAAGGELVCGARVRGLRCGDGAFRLALSLNEPAPRRGGAVAPAADPAAQREVLARAVVVCTGGLSYPETGSTGDGYAWAQAHGHALTELRPALVGLHLDEAWPRRLAGLAWDDARAELFAPAPGPAKALGAERAEILFTHFGVSGPAIIDLSNVFVREGLARARLRLDFFPDRAFEALDADLLARFKQHPARRVARALEGLLPTRLLEQFEALLGKEGEACAGKLPRDARRRLAQLIKALELTVSGTRGMHYGEVTAGGVAWEGLDPATMQSRAVPGLFFAGEILDLAGRCGGFNLQAAFSTGWLAGESAARTAVRSEK